MNSKMIIDGTLCTLVFNRYLNGQLDLQVKIAKTDMEKFIFAGEPMGHPSYPDDWTQLTDNEILIKNYSEYAGWPELFVKAGLMEHTGKVSAQFDNIIVMRVLVDVPERKEIKR